jgi:hypothetical protein
MEIPMHPDECVHGNTHIEGVNECPSCQRDRYKNERDEARRKLNLAREEVGHLQRDVALQRDWKWKAEGEVQALEKRVAALEAENDKLRSEAFAATSWANGHDCGEENRILYERAGQMESERNTARAEIESLQQDAEAERDDLCKRLQEAQRGCPCKHVTPCHERCTCVTPFSSSGCRRCCKYGSVEQQRSAAERIAAAVDEAEKMRAARESGIG